MFEDLNVAEFWDNCEYALQNYVDKPLSSELITQVESALGYKLPVSYVALMQLQNGGTPHNTNHRTSEPTSWAEDHVAITGISAIGFDTRYALCGEFGSKFWIREWGYPPIGVYFADCPSAGHDMLCLDYSASGPHGEPRVVHVDQEFGYKVTHVASDFETFIRGLEPDENFPD